MRAAEHAATLTQLQHTLHIKCHLSAPHGGRTDSLENTSEIDSFRLVRQAARGQLILNARSHQAFVQRHAPPLHSAARLR